jgi:hypothetical protein
LKQKLKCSGHITRNANLLEENTKKQTIILGKLQGKKSIKTTNEMDRKSGIINSKSGIINSKSGIINSKSGIINSKKAI